MKQFTTPEQTTKLIELGFEKPKSERLVPDVVNESTPSIQNIVKRQDYSIGELIELLGYDLYSMHYLGMSWEVKGEQVAVINEELIDALYDIIIKLKEKGVI